MVIFGGIVERYQNRLKQHRAEGVTEGLAQGEAQEREKWDAWNRRRLDAEANGSPFAEPPPSAPQVEADASR